VELGVEEVLHMMNLMGKWNVDILHMYLEKVNFITFSKYEIFDALESISYYIS
jgi:hypothetical protein